MNNTFDGIDRYVGHLKSCVVFIFTFYLLYRFVALNQFGVIQFHLSLVGELLLVGAALALPFLVFVKGARLAPLENIWLWVVTAVALVISSILAQRSHASFDRLELIFAVVFFSFVVRLWLVRLGSRIYSYFALGVALAHAVFLLLAIDATTKATTQEIAGHDWVPYHDHIRHISYHGMIASCLCAIAVNCDRSVRLAAIILSGVCLGGVIFFGARGAFFGWVGFAALAVTLVRSERVKVLKQLFAIFALGATFSYSLSAGGFVNPFNGSILDRVDSFNSAVQTTGRVEIWGKALKGFEDRPFFGQGADGYRLTQWGTKGTVQPHNTVVQFLVEYGIVGFGLILVLIFKTFYRRTLLLLSAPPSEGRRVARLLLAMLGGVGCYAMVDGLLYHAIPMLLIAICLVFYGAMLREGVSVRE